VAVLVYLTALGNGFALDDEMIVQLNPAAHSVGAALGAFDQPYWPPQHGAGTYRPLVILSFAADWQLSGGSTLWLHAVNVAWHAAATALLVPILAVYVGPAGALAGGVVFAVHPVHVGPWRTSSAVRSCSWPPSSSRRCSSRGACGAGAPRAAEHWPRRPRSSPP
jgi:hypothetical protein